MKFQATHTLAKTCALVAFTALIASANISHAAKSGYYKWTDDSGKVQFTQTPPTGKSSVFISTATGTQSKSPDAEPETTKAASPADTPAANLDGKLEALPEKDPAQCDQAKGNLERLKSKAQIRLTLPDGKQRFINEEERNTQIKLAEDNIAIHCDN